MIPSEGFKISALPESRLIIKWLSDPVIFEKILCFEYFINELNFARYYYL